MYNNSWRFYDANIHRQCRGVVAGEDRPPHNLRWRECEPELAAKLETAYQKGMTVFTNEWDGWVYQYNLQNMTQTSLCAPHTERAVRRVMCSSPA